MEATRLLSAAFVEAHPEDAARVLERLSAPEQASLLARCSVSAAAQAVQHFPPTAAASCLLAMSAADAGNILTQLPLDAKVAVVRPLAEQEREALLSTLTPASAEPLQRLLHYPEGTAGALMDPYVLTLPDDITVADALRRAKASSQRILYYLYVIDREQRLVGVTTLRDLMRARPGESLASVMQREVARLSAYARSEDVLKSRHWRAYHALPVVDEKGFFLGVIRYETLQRLQHDLEPSDRAGDALGTVLALGELYWIGLAGMLRGVPTEGGGRPDD